MICPTGYDCTFIMHVDNPMEPVWWLIGGCAILLTIVLVFFIYRKTGGR